MKTIVNKTYLPTTNKYPRWAIERCVKTTVYEFVATSLETGEIIGKTRLFWMRDSAEKHNMYHGFSYHWGGYNPTPVTGVFHGVPLGKMLEWCDKNGLLYPEIIEVYTNVTYRDVDSV